MCYVKFTHSANLSPFVEESVGSIISPTWICLWSKGIQRKLLPFLLFWFHLGLLFLPGSYSSNSHIWKWWSLIYSCLYVLLKVKKLKVWKLKSDKTLTIKPLTLKPVTLLVTLKHGVTLTTIAPIVTLF